MATITPTTAELAGDGSVYKWTYAAMTNATSDVGSAIGFAQYADRSIQVLGTFGAAGNLRLEGSNDGGTTWAVLTDPQGNNLDFTAAKIEAITELCAQIRPRVTAGDGTTSLTVVILARKTQPGRNS
jgi:hypothetical protein